MKNMLLSLLLAAGIAANTAYSQSKDFIEIGMQNKSIISGFTASDEPMIRARFGFKKGNYNINALADYDPEKNNVRELDINLSGSITEIGPVNISGYAGYFMYPYSELHDMQEIGIIPSIRIEGYDVNNYLAKFTGKGSGNGWINKTSVARQVSLTDKISLTPSAQLVFNDHYFTQSSGFSHASISAVARWELPNFNIVAKGYKQWMLSDHFNHVFKNDWYAGLGIEKGW